MLLTLTTTHRPATDLGYLLAKNPAKLHSFELSYGRAHVFYPVATEERCTAALLLEVDPIGLVRGRPQGEARTLLEYVNDRPYVASSFLSVAIAQVFGSALGGRSRERQELADTPLPLDITLTALPCRGGELFLRRLFEPLGYRVSTTRLPLDPTFPEWGDSVYCDVRLAITARLADVLCHLYVLIPVLDDEKHYWVGEEEVAKLLAKGEGWLPTHPEKEQITLRYLKHRRHLAKLALDRLVSEEGGLDLAEEDDARATNEVAVEAKLSLNDLRIHTVVAALEEAGANSVIDLGCGEGRLLRQLLRNKRFTRITGVDVSPRTLEIAEQRMRFDRMPKKVHERIQLIQGALTYRDARFVGYDAAALVEVIEHVDPSRLAAVERVVFEFARPRTVLVTTPNSEFNASFPDLPAGHFRHGDHRFEWTRAEFLGWATSVASRFGYALRVLPVGPLHPDFGPPTQMAVFTLGGSEVPS